MIYSLAKPLTTSPSTNVDKDSNFLQEYVHELLSSFYFPKSLSSKLNDAVKNSTFKIGVFNETLDFADETDNHISSTYFPTLPVSLTDINKIAITSMKSTGERTARQTTAMSSDPTSESNNDEPITFPPKPFYKATIEKVTLKPKTNNFGFMKKKLSAIIPESTYNIKISDRSNISNSTANIKPILMVGDLFHNSLDTDSKKENLVLYDMDYVKWLFNIFYQEMKKNNVLPKVTYTKVQKVFLNMLAEIGSVRSKWLNKSMAKHYATHFERKRYDNEKRKTLDEEDLSYASKNIHSLISQYFDTNERVSSVPLRLPTKTSQVPNLSLSSKYPDKELNNQKSESKVKVSNAVKWSPPERVQSILKNIQHYGGVSRNSGSFPKISFNNSSKTAIHKMEEYSITRNAVARDIFRLIGSISSINERNTSTKLNSSSKFPSNSLDIENLPDEISNLLVNTIKRSK